MTRRPEHDPVPRRLAEPRMRGPIVPADVGLEFDDPPDATTRCILAYESCTDERPAHVEGRAREEGPVDGAQALG